MAPDACHVFVGKEGFELTQQIILLPLLLLST
jgi:hypothetical protein